MGKSNSVATTFKSRMKEEYTRQKTEDAAVKASFRLADFIKKWGLRLFYLLFFGGFIYFIILFCMMIIPTVMGYVVGGLGYNLGNTAEIVLSSLSGLFFTAWVFFGSYKLISSVGKLFVKGWKSAGAKKADK